MNTCFAGINGSLVARFKFQDQLFLVWRQISKIWHNFISGSPRESKSNNRANILKYTQSNKYRVPVTFLDHK